MKFSIIVPVYNVEAYLEKCLQSVLNQSFQDYEIIIVDDETPDNSMAVAEKIKQSAPSKIQIIHQKNKGLGGARNTGVQAASGEYLVFLDSDDYLHPHMLAELAARLTKFPADIAIFNFLLVTTSGKIVGKRNICPEEKLCRTTEEKSPLLLSLPAACNKVYKRSFYLNCHVSFPEKIWYEDIITRYLIAKAESILLCPGYWYCYVQRDQSIMHSDVSPRTLDMITATNYLMDIVRNDDLSAYNTVLEASLTVSLFVIAQNAYTRHANNPYTMQLLNYLTQQFPNYASNPLLPSEYPAMIQALLMDNSMAYRYHNARHKLKESLFQCTWIQKLNALRKR